MEMENEETHVRNDCIEPPGRWGALLIGIPAFWDIFIGIIAKTSVGTGSHSLCVL
jgi:hypothetical protein